MDDWKVTDELDVDLDGIDEVTAAIVGGELAVTVAPGPVHLEIRVLQGDPVRVERRGGRLEIGYGDPDLGVGPLEMGALGDIIESAISVVRERPFGVQLGWHRHRKAAVLLTVPPGTRLRLRGASASVLVAGVRAAVDVATLSGDITLDDLAGEVTVQTASGDVEALALAGPLRIATASGDVTVARASCPQLDAKAVSGDLTVDAVLTPGGRYDLKSVSGDVMVGLPGNANVDIEAGSLSGRIDADVGLTGERGGRGRRLTAVLGAGEARLRVKTVSGKILLVRREPAGQGAR